MERARLANAGFLHDVPGSHTNFQGVFMSMVRLGLRGVSLAVVGLLSLSACGDDDPAGPEELDLSGTYELVSLTFQGQPALVPPIATGTINLTKTEYDIDILIDLPPPQGETIEDVGTYSIDGTSWSQESSLTGMQSVGTVSLVNGRLEVNATTLGQTTITVWDRIP